MTSHHDSWGFSTLALSPTATSPHIVNYHNVLFHQWLLNTIHNWAKKSINSATLSFSLEIILALFFHLSDFLCSGGDFFLPTNPKSIALFVYLNAMFYISSWLSTSSQRPPTPAEGLEVDCHPDAALGSPCVGSSAMQVPCRLPPSWWVSFLCWDVSS